jgi:exodeoxyribonuclease III
MRPTVAPRGVGGGVCAVWQHRRVLRVVTFNVNGIRAAVRRGFREWLEASGGDVVCLQEVRAPAAALAEAIPDGWVVSYAEGDRAGRNGVAVPSREVPSAVRTGFASTEFDEQGRYLEVDLPGLTVGSLYLPKGDVAGERYEAKMLFCKQFAEHLHTAAAVAAAGGRQVVVGGDWNIAHTNADIRSWKTNLKSVGFLPEERAWFGGLLEDGAVVDVLRALHPETDGPYTWWSWRGKAFDDDAGWRIDHQLASAGLAARAVTGAVVRAASYTERLSDHAAVVVDYDDVP